MLSGKYEFVDRNNWPGMTDEEIMSEIDRMCDDEMAFGLDDDDDTYENDTE